MRQKFGKTIVIKREGEIEDVYLTTPIIEALKEKHPDSLIILMTRFTDAVEGCFSIDAHANFGAPVPCDILIDLDYAYEKDFRKHIVDCYAEVAKVKPKKRTGDLYTEKKDVEYVKNILKDMSDFVALDYGDNIQGRKWKKQNYIELGHRIKQDGFKIVTVGKTSEQHPDHLDADLNLINVLSLPQTALVISKSRLFIGSDGLLSHYAQTTHAPHIILFGCTSPEYVSDTSLTMFTQVVTPVACRGCRHRYASGTTVLCQRNFMCMDSISVDMVYEAFKESIAKGKPEQK
jgi:ADP-heptose:LPS heptosyltransferase